MSRTCTSNVALHMSVVGDWVQRGTTIFTLNGEPVRADLSFAAHVLSGFTVDPDGFIRVAARYRPLGVTRAQNGLLALPAHRMVGLENGMTFDIRNADGTGWQTVVASVPEGSASGVQPGDILVSENATSTMIDGPESLDAVLEGLVSQNTPEAQLTILRNGSETTAKLQLAQE